MRNSTRGRKRAPLGAPDDCGGMAGWPITQGPRLRASRTCRPASADDEKRLAKLDRLAVFDQNLCHHATDFSVDFIK